MRDDVVVDDLVVAPEPMEPHLAAVTPLDDFYLLLEYETGERKRFDVKPYLGVGMYRRLNDEAYFKTARLEHDGWFVGWPEGEDLAPEDLYGLGVPVE